jgi:hypothetical protein
MGISTVQANYINALAVSVLPFFEPAKGTLGGFSNLAIDDTAVFHSCKGLSLKLQHLCV